MSSLRPPLPPRRNAPPPPPPRRISTIINPAVDTPTPTGIAARIAALQLSQIDRKPLAKPPPLPRTPSNNLNTHNNTQDETDNPQLIPRVPSILPRGIYPTPEQIAERGPEFSRLLSRRPPPVPLQSTSSSPKSTPNPAPELPKRRLPPKPARLPTPPPEPEYEYEQQEQAFDQQEEALEPSLNSEPTSCLKCYDFSHVDVHATHFPRQTVSSLDTLAHDLTRPFSSDTEKSRAIFTWLHHNIAYDCDAFFSGNLRPATPESTLRSGLAVCEGYAGLFKSLAERVGLQVHCVTGHGKGYGYAALAEGESVPEPQSNHAWNCVSMDGNWHLIDCCWGAGALEGMTYNQRFSPAWFTSTPEEFGKRHYPTEDSSFQLADQMGVVSWEDYIMQPEGPTIFGDFHQLDLHPDLLQSSTRCIRGGTRAEFHVSKHCEHMSTAEKDNYVFIIVTAGGGSSTPMVRDAKGGWSADVYIPVGAGDVSLYSVKLVDGRDGLGLGVYGFNQANGRKAMAFGGLAVWMTV